VLSSLSFCIFYFPFLLAYALARCPFISGAAISLCLFRRVHLQCPANLPSLSSASEHYVGVWAPLVGGHVRAEGRDFLLLVLHAPACLGRLDVRLLARLTRPLGNSRVCV